MRHLKAGNRLGVTTAHRLAMMRNMVTSIIENGQITCTLARAKEVRKPLEKMIGLGKRGTLHSRRQALRFVKSKEAMAQLFGDLAERYKDRNGGYCRIIKLGKNRLGDNSEMAIIQLLGSEGDKLSELKTQKGAKKKQKKKESTVLKEVSEEILQVPETEENAEKELKQENDTQASGTEESAEAENKIESGEEELIQEEKQPETKTEDTVEIENKVQADEEDGDSAKDAVKKESQAEVPLVQNEAETEHTEPEKPEAKTEDTKEIENVKKLGDKLSATMDLMLDPACEIKNFSDTIKLGRACDEANFFWLEDPYQDGGVSQFAHKKLKEMIKTPILQTEHIRLLEQHVDFIVSGGTDYVRAGAHEDGGITGVMKIAHATEGFGLDVELHGPGPVHRHIMLSLIHI